MEIIVKNIEFSNTNYFVRKKAHKYLMLILNTDGLAVVANEECILHSSHESRIQRPLPNSLLCKCLETSIILSKVL